MRAIVTMTILAFAAVLSAPAHAQYPTGTTPFCVSGRGCVPMTNASYTSCYQLGLHRGYNASIADQRNLELFVYQCLSGRIPR